MKLCAAERVIDVAYELNSLWVPDYLYELKCPYMMTPQGIVVHNTSGKASAANEANFMVNNPDPTGYHVVIDDKEVWECIPFNRNAFHAGDGGAGYANRNLIGIEIAYSQDYGSDRYYKAETNAVEYIAYVCIQYGWTSANLHQHNWYSKTDCPHRLKLHWEQFKRRVDKKIAELLNDNPASNPIPDTVPGQTKKDTITVSLHGWEREVKGIIKDGTSYVAIRDLLGQMGYDVDWDADEKMVVVNYKK